MTNPTRLRAVSRTVAATTVAILTATGLAAVACATTSDGEHESGATLSPSSKTNDDPKQGPVNYPRPVAKPLPKNGVEPIKPTGVPDYTFLSAPDFMNSDIADVSALSTWSQGMPNSWNSSYAATVDTIMSTFQGEGPEDVFVAGDLVEGHWGEDADDTGLFGPANTNSQKKAALRRAADFYFSKWRQRFDDRGLPVYAAVGDHDIGDNPWSGGSDPAEKDFKRNNMEVFKASFYKNVLAKNRVSNRPSGPAHNTAYATYVNPEVLLVSVDVFQRTSNDVIAQLDHLQVKWLDRVLADAERRGTDWIIVQGHTPVITPVRTYGSSAMSHVGGPNSEFWKTMVKHHVDIYLNGEVHDVSVQRAGGITQIAHGGTIQMAAPSGVGSTNYVLAEIFGNQMWLRDNRFTPKMIDASKELWQIGRTHRPVVRKEVWDKPLAIAHMVLTSDNRLVYSDGAFIPYNG
jgi:hypothetical protein